MPTLNLTSSLPRAVAIAFCISVFALSVMPQRRDTRGMNTQATRLPDTSKRFALIVGINEYQNSQVTDLQGAANDAKELAKALKQYAGFSERNITTLVSERGAIDSLDYLPTRSNIQEQMSETLARAREAGSDSLVLIAFAGHGVVRQAEGNNRKGEAYFVPMDGLLNRIGDTSIKLADVRDEIERSGIEQVVILVDACRNDPQAGRSLGDNPLTEPFKSAFDFQTQNRGIKAYVTLYATGIGQRAYEYNDGGQTRGYFTSTLVKGLAGAAANTRGEITLANLISYVEREVPSRVNSGRNRDRVQIPFSDIEGSGAISLVLSTSRDRAMPDAETTLWETIKNSRSPRDFENFLARYPRGRYAQQARENIRRLQGEQTDTPPPPEKTFRQEAAFFTFELNRCRISGSSVLCDFTITNNDVDRNLQLHEYNSGIVDNLGNQYRVSNMQLANSSNYSLMVRGVPTRARIMYESVNPSATSISLMILDATARNGSNSQDIKIRFRNIPLNGASNSDSRQIRGETAPPVQSSTSDRKRTITVQPGSDWIDTGVFVEPGMRIDVVASGAISTHAGGTSRTAGVAGGIADILLNSRNRNTTSTTPRRAGAEVLQARIKYMNGGYSRTINVGARNTLVVEPNEYGQLVLGIASHYSSYRYGSFTIALAW